LAGSAAGDYDVDGGVTSARSPAVTLPSSGTLSSQSWLDKKKPPSGRWPARGLYVRPKGLEPLTF
ncbi:hypothetical protein AB0J68_09290, partial [Micromonospora sp. NPDC049580]|uniref:hypothetical protein n=1 Tax=Micromonospora sp. NPDC049580 TaxID=3154832 RepID=UPI003442BD4E